jgi:RNA polymerase sigma-70 factor, ECF subfamily
VSNFAHRLEQEIPALRRYARYLLRDAEKADDLVQDCLERAIAKRRLWHDPDRLRPWLFALMRNLHLNQVRHLGRRPSEVPIDAVAPLAAHPESQLERVAATQALAALEDLDPDQREVLILAAVEGLPYREIAETLGVPLGTVMSRLSRGRARMRSAMAAEPPGTTTLRRIK